MRKPYTAEEVRQACIFSLSEQDLFPGRDLLVQGPARFIPSSELYSSRNSVMGSGNECRIERRPDDNKEGRGKRRYKCRKTGRQRKALLFLRLTNAHYVLAICYNNSVGRRQNGNITGHFDETAAAEGIRRVYGSRSMLLKKA